MIEEKTLPVLIEGEPQFRIIELKMAEPGTGARFWIEWLVEMYVEPYDSTLFIGALRKIGILPKYKKVKRWIVFSDPASSNQNIGYVDKASATYVIERYIRTMTPTIHPFVNPRTHNI